jgi:hypothetical protein
MNRIKWLVVILTIVATGTLYGDNDVTTGMIEDYQIRQPVNVELPADFNVEEARTALRAARANGDQALVEDISTQLQTWWRNNANVTFGPEEQGSNPNPGPQWNIEKDNPVQNGSPDWGSDIRMDPRDGIRDVNITSISNGDLYAFCLWIDGTEDYGVILRSTDDGVTWNVAWNNSFGTTDIYDLGIVNDNDTLITWYILHNTSANTYRTWVRVCNPDASCSPIYWGSPTGNFNPIQYDDLHCCTDAAVWGTSEYVYATWSETYGTGPDSTRVMSAVSQENDVSTWETGPTRLRASNGSNIYYTGTRTAFGSATDMLWVVAWLHPNGYPTSFDRFVRGWYSTDYGTTWNSTPVDISDSNDGRDEYDCVVGGSHINTNWVVLATQVDTGSGGDLDVNNWYSTDDGTAWTWAGWVSNSYDNFLGDIWVDDNSNAFYGALRQNTSTNQYVRIKTGDITDPASWSGSLGINDNTTNLSNVYGPSISYNMGLGEAIMAWVDYNAALYSIWFDSESWTGIGNHAGQVVSPLAIALAPNPAKSIAAVSFTTQTAGRVAVSLYDATGRLIENLVDETRVAGTYSTTIQSDKLASGIYFVRVETPDGVGTKTMTIVR